MAIGKWPICNLNLRALRGSVVNKSRYASTPIYSSPLTRRYGRRGVQALQGRRATGTMAAMKHIQRESLIHDPIHGYIPFISVAEPGETAERTLLDHPW